MTQYNKKIHHRIEDNIALIRMDDGKANAMDVVFFEELRDAINLAEIEEASAIIIAGRNGFFSSGLDLKLLSKLSPRELNSFAEMVSETMLRIYSLSIPTIAACGGHAIGAGAMLAFACDLRFVVDGPYRIQLDEVIHGVPLFSWMLLVGRTAIPVAWQTEALLHAKEYSPSEAVERGIFHGLVKSDEDLTIHVKGECERLKKLSLSAYHATKKRMRDKDVKHVAALLKEELPAQLE